MYWQEESETEQYAVPDDVVDLLFSIKCDTLPVDHAWSLSQQIQQSLTWFENEPKTGLHLIHVADSGNGWERPQGAEDLLYLSRRTKLIIRVPKERTEDTMVLTGQTLDVDGHTMEIKTAKSRLLAMTPILYSRYVVCDPTWSEDEFMTWAVGELKKLRLRFKKILCGKSSQLSTPEGPISTRTFMVHNMPFEDAVILQEEGIGPKRNMGCGLFIPQKSF